MLPRTPNRPFVPLSELCYMATCTAERVFKLLQLPSTQPPPPAPDAVLAAVRASTARFAEVVRQERARPRPSLLRACRLSFGCEFLALGWLKAANVGLGFSGPLLLKVVVNAVQEAARGEEGGCHYAACFVSVVSPWAVLVGCVVCCLFSMCRRYIQEHLT